MQFSEEQKGKIRDLKDYVKSMAINRQEVNNNK